VQCKQALQLHAGVSSAGVLRTNNVRSYKSAHLSYDGSMHRCWGLRGRLLLVLLFCQCCQW
jgi:hypothetical protein